MNNYIDDCILKYIEECNLNYSDECIHNCIEDCELDESEDCIFDENEDCELDESEDCIFDEDEECKFDDNDECIHNYNCPDCNEAKLQSDKNARKINEVIEQVNTLIEVNNETVDYLENKVDEIIEDKVDEIAEDKVNEIVEDKVNEIVEIKANEVIEEIVEDKVNEIVEEKANTVIEDKVNEVVGEAIGDIQLSLEALETEVEELKDGNINIDLTNYATKDFVEDSINNAKLDGGGSQVDLSSYAKKTDLHEHSNKSVLDNITSSKVTQWDNKSNFSGNYNDLTNKPTIPSKTSQLTNDKGFITSIPSEYITETELNNKGYLTQHQDISGKADKSTLTAHTSDTNIHITETERNTWNNMANGGNVNIEELEETITGIVEEVVNEEISAIENTIINNTVDFVEEKATEIVEEKINEVKCYGIFKNGEEISIVKDTDVVVPMTTVVNANGISLDNDGAINIPSDGLYIITASLSWSQNDNGFRKVALEHYQKDVTTDRLAIATSQIRAVSGGQTSQNVSTHCYCRSGDKIKLSVHQDTSRTIKLVEWSDSVIITISKI